MIKVKAGFTVEASLILPLILMVFLMAMSTGIRLYEECLQTAEQISQEEYDAVKWFYRCRELGELIEWN